MSQIENLGSGIGGTIGRFKSSCSSSESKGGAIGRFKSFASCKKVWPGPGGTKLGYLIIAVSPGAFSESVPDASAGFWVGQWP